MRRPELDFLHETPRLPQLAWLLFAAGIALAVLSMYRYVKAEQALAGERAIAASLTAKRPASKVERLIRPNLAEVATSDREQLDTPWDALFVRLEQNHPKGIALVSLEANGRKREATLTVEAKKPDVMLDYVEKLRNQHGLAAVVLSSHEVRIDDPQQPLRFVVRLRWGA